MRIVLSGATGQLCGALHGNLTRLGEVSAPTRAAFDLAVEESVRQTLDALRPDLIVNAAAYTAVDRAEEERGAEDCVEAWRSGTNWGESFAHLCLVDFAEQLLRVQERALTHRGAAQPTPAAARPSLTSARAVRPAPARLWSAAHP